MPRKTTAAKPVAPKAAKDVVEPVTVVTDETAPVEKKRAYKPKNTLTLNSMVTVRNGFNGTLIYKSSKTGERFVWSGFGDEQDMEVQELRNAKNSNKAFFENNWFMIDPEVIEFIGVERYYRNALSFEAFDSLFDLSPTEIEERVALIPVGQKASVAYRAKQLIAEGRIDSIRAINALEKSLGVELIER